VKASRGGTTRTRAGEPAVLCNRSLVATLSFTSTGMPWSGPRGPLALRSASSAAACPSASGLVSRIACSPGPFRSSSSIRWRYAVASAFAVYLPDVIPACSAEMVVSSSSNGAGASLTPRASAGKTGLATATAPLSVRYSTKLRRSIGRSVMGALLNGMTQGGNRDKLAATFTRRPAMARVVGGQSDVGRLRRVAVKPVREAFGTDTLVERQWRDLRYTARPDVAGAEREYERFLSLLSEAGVDEVIVLPLPHWRGPDDVFHLMSIASPIDTDLWLVHAPLLPVPFRESLSARGIELVEVASSEFETLGCNVLALAPREVVMVAGNPETRRRLERAGVGVQEFAGQEICLKGGGGPTCLTRPLVRDAT